MKIDRNRNDERRKVFLDGLLRATDLSDGDIYEFGSHLGESAEIIAEIMSSLILPGRLIMVDAFGESLNISEDDLEMPD